MSRNRDWTRAVLAVALTLALAVLVAFALGALTAASRAAEATDFSWNGTLSAGQTLEIRGINGEVRAEAAAGKTASVTATKTARRSDPSKVRIHVEKHADGVTICAVYPRRDGTPGRDCRDGQKDIGDNDVAVDFRVQLPEGVRLVARTVNGKIVGRGLASVVEATTVNGSVELSTSLEAEASTVNGSIETSLGAADGKDPLVFSTVNGSITLELERGAGMEIEASTVNGRISTDLPITVRGKIGKHSLKGTIGKGGRTVKLSTVNGSIRLQVSD